MVLIAKIFLFVMIILLLIRLKLQDFIKNTNAYNIKNLSIFKNDKNNNYICQTKNNSTNDNVSHCIINNTQKFAWTTSNKNSVFEYYNNKKLMNFDYKKKR